MWPHTGGVNDDDIDPAPRPKRRVFSAECKARILAEHDALPKGSSERGALLRREGLYSSHICEWRKQAEAGAKAGLGPKATKGRSRAEVELSKLRAKNERLEAELAKTRLALEITGKAHALLEMLSESADSETKRTK